MVTGIECAGLVLAVIPLVIEAAKVYSRGVETVRDVVETQRHTEDLEDFYEEFYFQTLEFRIRIKAIVDDLPGLSDERKAIVAESYDENDWKPGSDTFGALADYFGDDDFKAFQLIMQRVVKEMGQLIEDRAIYLTKNDLNTEKMYEKLKGLEASQKGDKFASKFKNRFRFRLKARERNKSLEMIDKWNNRLDRLTSRAKSQQKSRPVVSAQAGPSQRLRRLSELLYRALSSYWVCNCPTRHEARFCLRATEKGLYKAIDPPEVQFDLLFSTPKSVKWNKAWQEGRVLVRQASEASVSHSTVKFQIDPPPDYDEDDERYELQTICDVMASANQNDNSLHLLVEDHGQQQKLWQLRSLPKQLQFQEPTQAVSLESTLSDLPNDLRAQRVLALTLAYSLLQLSGSPWLNEAWNKEHVSFFHKSLYEVDYERPYLTTQFDDSPSSTAPDMNRLHRSQIILSLGIMLIEIHTGKPIEHFRNADELVNENVNTNLTVADRVAKALRNCSLDYQEAIMACLDTSWVPAGRKINLDDPLIRSTAYKSIVLPLENDLKHLFRETF